MSDRARGQWMLGLVLVVAAGAGLVALGEAGSAERQRAQPASDVRSGAWYCPHGGNEGWSATLAIANPGDDEVLARVTSFGPEEATEPETIPIAPGTTESVPVRAGSRGASSMVEYFGGWVAVGWVLNGGDDGASAEPCGPEAGTRFLMPDGTTDRGHTAYIVVMNPFSTDAAFTVTVYTEKRPPLVLGEWRDFVLRPRHSVALELNEAVAGEAAVAAEVETSLGRVSVASMGTLESGGLRAVMGMPRTGTRALMPGGLDTNTAMVEVLNLSDGHASFEAAVLTDDSEQTGAGLQNQTLEPRSARAFSVITSSPSSLDLRAQFETAAGGFVASRRTYGVSGDFGATGGTQAPRDRWVVLPAVTTSPYDPRLLLTNPGEEDVKVELRLLGAHGRSTQVAVPARRTVLVPTEFTLQAPTSAVLVEAQGGGVVPVFVAYSDDGADYAVAQGVPAQ